MEQLDLNLRQHAADLHQLWVDILLASPSHLPPNHDLDTLPGVIYDLVEVSLLWPHNIRAHEFKVAAALHHGEKCRQRGWDEQVIYAEFAALREAMRRHVGACDVPRAKAREALMRLNMAISVAEEAAVRGYHRDRDVEVGRWDEIVSELARKSPLLAITAA